MINRIWLFVLILSVPLVGLTVAESIKAYFNYELRSVLIEQLPDANPAIISNTTLDQFCENSESDIRELCDTNANLNLLTTGAQGSIAVGIILLLSIRLAGSIASNNRTLLLILFKPGLYFTALMLIGLIFVHAFIAIGAIYYGESILIGRIHIGIIVAIALGALIGILIMSQNVFAMVKKAQTFVIGTNLSRDEAPKLWGLVEQIADKIGALQPQHIVLGLEPNFFVTEANVACLNKNLSGRTLYCSLPLCRILSTTELTAIIGHELGHYKGLDTKFSGKFYPIYRGTTSTIESLKITSNGGAAIALLPAIAIFSYFLECFSIAESRISRERELSADREGERWPR